MQIDPNLILKYSKNLEVLYVEDDIDLQTATQKLLKRFFHIVDTADNGWEGLKYYQERMHTSKPYDLVLTDINMPKMSGIEMSSLILDMMPDQKIAIISAHNEVEYLQHAIELGISGFITKPIEQNQLFRQLLSLCSAIQDKKLYKEYVSQIAEQNRVFREQVQSRRLGSIQQEFLRNISHEIKTPLNAISGIASIIRKYIDSSDNRVEEFLMMVEESSILLDTLITRILNLSMLTSGNYQLSKEDHTLKPFLERMISEYTQKAKSAGITLNYSIDSILDMPVECDLAVVNTVIGELLDNAIKFNQNPGQIGLRIMYDQKLQALFIDIKDNGIGIDSAEQDKIFEIFYQVDGGLTRKAEGAGIGLALVKYMVELNGGNIKLESKLGEGAFFHVTLPVE